MNLSQASDRFLNGVVIEYVGYIPNDEYVKKAVRKRKPVLELYPSSTSSQRITKIAKSLLEWSRRTDTDGNLKFFLKRYIDYRAVG
jgi:flagellar biosynthesis protein FlhG